MWPLIERTVRNTRAAYVDLRLFLSGKTDPELPPLRLRDVGAGDFHALGQHLLDLSVTYAALRPDSHVLDIGCGAGRLALSLTAFLTNGRYEGFDVSRASIRWCTKHISPGHPHFHFVCAELQNSNYSWRGASAAHYFFPYAEASFDCVAGYSVFTHLMFDEAANYVRETYRVLVPGGRFISTHFLLNEASEAVQRAVPGVQTFPHQRGSARLASKPNPASAVAVEEDALVALLRQVGFCETVIHPGCWYGIQATPTFQDLVICTK